MCIYYPSNAEAAGLRRRRLPFNVRCLASMSVFRLYLGRWFGQGVCSWWQKGGVERKVTELAGWACSGWVMQIVPLVAAPACLHASRLLFHNLCWQNRGTRPWSGHVNPHQWLDKSCSCFVLAARINHTESAHFKNKQQESWFALWSDCCLRF